MTKIKVTGCKDCPFDRFYFINVCSHPEHEEPKEVATKIYANGITPSWCPLKKEPITIEIDE